jgi:hypothetical protein
MYSVIYKCTEIDSADAGKKALVWKKVKKCGAVLLPSHDGYGRDAGQTDYQICWRGGPDGECK